MTKSFKIHIHWKEIIFWRANPIANWIGLFIHSHIGGKKLKHNKKTSNQHQEMENIQIAIDAIKEDGITLINIGKDYYIFSRWKEITLIRQFHMVSVEIP